MQAEALCKCSWAVSHELGLVALQACKWAGPRARCAWDKVVAWLALAPP